jgi:hypothetical protein
MCGSIELVTGLRTRPLLTVREEPSVPAVQAFGGYVFETAGESSFTYRLIVRRTDSSPVAISHSGSDTTWINALESFYPALSGPDPQARRCLDVLGFICLGEPWRSVSQGGRTFTAHLSYEGGFRRGCGMRGAVVCPTYVGMGYQRAPLVTLDTVWLAP